MQPTTNRSHLDWQRVRSILVCLAIIPLLIPVTSLSHLSAGPQLSIPSSEKNIQKLPGDRAGAILAPTAVYNQTTADDWQSTPKQPGGAELPSFQDVWAGFLEEDVAKASWVSVEGGFSLPIIQQPPGKVTYVSNKPDIITQFNRPALNGVTALLAHNYRSGKEFYNLTIGQRITVTYNGMLERDYQVVSIDSFQKLNNASGYSNLIDLKTEAELTSTDVYNRFYWGAHRVTFQTCLEREGRLDWGLYFVVATPLDTK